MNVIFTRTPHGTIHGIGTAAADESVKLRRSIASRAGKLHVGQRLRATERVVGGAVIIRVAYQEV